MLFFVIDFSWARRPNQILWKTDISPSYFSFHSVTLTFINSHITGEADPPDRHELEGCNGFLNCPDRSAMEEKYGAIPCNPNPSVGFSNRTVIPESIRDGVTNSHLIEKSIILESSQD